MLEKAKQKTIDILRWSEKYTKTDMVYLARASFWMNLNLFIVTVLSFILSVSFARLISKENYGVYQFILAISGILGSLTLTGINSSITQSVARGYEGSLKKAVPLQLKYGVIPFFAGTLLSVYYFINGNTTLFISLLIVSVLIPIQNSFNTYSAFIAGKKDFRIGFWSGLILFLSYFVSMIVALSLTQNPIYLISVNLGINTIIGIVLYLLTIKIYKPNEKEDRSTLSFGKHLSLANIIGTVVGQLDNILVYHYIGAAELAVYAFASTIPERLMGLTKGISIAALPKFSEQSREDIKNNILKKSLQFGLISLLISISYIIAAPLVYKIFFPQYLDSVIYSQAYALVVFFSSLSSLPTTALISQKSQKAIYQYNIVSPLISSVALLTMVNLYGIWGIIMSKAFLGIFNFIFLIQKNHGTEER